MATSPRTAKLLHELDVIDQREDVILNALVDRGSKLQAVVDEAERRSRTVTVDDLAVINDALGAVAQATVDLQARIGRAQAAKPPSTDASFDQLAASIREHSAEADALRTTLRERLTVLDPPGPEQDDKPGPEIPRTFVLKKQPMTGADIKRFQRELNARFATWKIAIHIREDGRYGQQTRLAALRAARGLGVDAEMQRGVTPRLRSLIRDPRRRTPEHRARAVEMRPWLIRLRKSHPLSARHTSGSGSAASPQAGGRSELAAAIRANGGRYEDLIIAEAGRVNLPVSLVCAVLDKESDFSNVFGHDDVRNPIKSPPGRNLAVTEKLYKEYLRHRNAGKGVQGVGPMQLTSAFLQDRADGRGGCWKHDVNISVGVEHLADLIKARKSTRLGLRDYNGSIEYADAVLKLKATWDKRLAGASAKAPKPVTPSPVKPDGPVKLGQRPTFRVKRTPMKGKNVAAFQRALNHRYAIWKIGRRVEVDGVYGPDTADAAREILRGLGVHRDDYAGGITPELRILIRKPKNRRTPQQLRRAALRRPWLLKLRKRYGADASGGVVRPLETRAGGNSEFHMADGEGAPANSGKRFHAGKDWFAAGGSAVKAPVSGKIVEAKPSNNTSGQVFGGTVKIQAADGKVWVFRHVVPKVSVGERVTAGDRVATVTKWTGGSSHAHIEIWKTFKGGYDLENMIDPMTYFKRWA